MPAALVPVLVGLTFAAVTAVLESLQARRGPPPEPPGLELMRRYYQAHELQDLAALEALLDEDFQLVLTGGPYADGAMDKREAIAYLRASWSHSGGTHRVVVRELFAEEGGGAALVLERGTRGELGLKLEEEAVHLFRFRGLRLWQLRSLSQRPDSFAAFWRQDAGIPPRHPRPW